MGTKRDRMIERPPYFSKKAWARSRCFLRSTRTSRERRPWVREGPDPVVDENFEHGGPAEEEPSAVDIQDSAGHTGHRSKRAGKSPGRNGGYDENRFRQDDERTSRAYGPQPVIADDALQNAGRCAGRKSTRMPHGKSNAMGQKKGRPWRRPAKKSKYAKSNVGLVLRRTCTRSPSFHWPRF